MTTDPDRAATPTVPAHLRIARPVLDLSRSVRQYRIGLSLEEIAAFEDHDGFDGVMLGYADGQFHLEFTTCRHHPVQPSPTAEDLLVFYHPVLEDWNARCRLMREAGFVEVTPFNPYWSRDGRTFRDRDGYTVIIQYGTWSNAGDPPNS